MKKFLLAALCLALAVCCAFGVAACTPTPGDIDDPSQPVDPSEPHTHSFGEWEVVTPATCEAEGEEQRVCACGEKETRTLPARGHNYVDGVCTRCGDELVPTDGSCFTFTELDDGSYAVAWNRTTELPREVVIPWEYNGKPVTQIASSAFEEYDGQMSVTIPDSVTSIGAGAFYDCSGLTSVAIPSSVTSIGMVAFYQCSGLTSIAIPDGVTSIGMGAFLGCSSVTDIFIPAGVTSIEGNVFGNCYALASLNVAEENAVYYSVNNCIIERESKALVVGCKTSVIPSDGSVTSIGDFVFYGCSDLTSVTIPGGVTSIGASAFSDCDGLTSIAIPGGVTSIGNSAFTGCDSLTSVYITDLAAWRAIVFGEGISDPLHYASHLYCNGQLVTDLTSSGRRR